MISRITGDCRKYVAPSTQFGIPSPRRRVEVATPATPAPVQEGARFCKVCGGGIPEMENGRKVRFDTMTCSPACRKAEINRHKRERIARNRAAKVVDK